MKYQIIYLVSGERHACISTYTSLAEANRDLALWRRGGFKNAWVEEIR